VRGGGKFICLPRADLCLCLHPHFFSEVYHTILKQLKFEITARTKVAASEEGSGFRSICLPWMSLRFKDGLNK